MHASHAEAIRNAGKDLAVKIYLEQLLTLKLRSYFQDLTQEFKAVYASTGRIIDATEFNAELEALLRQHYRKVRQHFGFQFRKKLLKVSFVDLQLKETEREDDEDLAASAAWLTAGSSTATVDEQQSQYIAARAKGQAQKINATTNSDLDRAVTRSIGAALVNQQSMAPSEIVDSAAAGFADSAEDRINTIAATETSPPAEALRFTEANALTGIGLRAPDGQPLARGMHKAWVSVLDSVTRHWHAEADGQIREYSEPYEVDGEQLMVPGDSSLGATARNIIHCRCSSQSFFKNRTAA